MSEVRHFLGYFLKLQDEWLFLMRTGRRGSIGFRSDCPRRRLLPRSSRSFHFDNQYFDIISDNCHALLDRRSIVGHRGSFDYIPDTLSGHTQISCRRNCCHRTIIVALHKPVCCIEFVELDCIDLQDTFFSRSRRADCYSGQKFPVRHSVCYLDIACVISCLQSHREGKFNFIQRHQGIMNWSPSQVRLSTFTSYNSKSGHHPCFASCSCDCFDAAGCSRVHLDCRLSQFGFDCDHCSGSPSVHSYDLEFGHTSRNSDRCRYFIATSYRLSFSLRT